MCTVCVQVGSCLLDMIIFVFCVHSFGCFVLLLFSCISLFYAVLPLVAARCWCSNVSACITVSIIFLLHLSLIAHNESMWWLQWLWWWWCYFVYVHVDVRELFSQSHTLMQTRTNIIIKCRHCTIAIIVFLAHSLSLILTTTSMHTIIYARN